MKNIKKKNHLKIIIFTAVKYCCILHRRVCVMYFNDRVFGQLFVRFLLIQCHRLLDYQQNKVQSRPIESANKIQCSGQHSLPYCTGNMDTVHRTKNIC